MATSEYLSWSVWMAHQLQSRPLNGRDVVLSAIAILAIAFFSAYSRARCGGNIALLREPSGKAHFSLMTRLAYYTDCASLFKEAYQKFSKKGLPVWVPSLGTRNDILMPHQHMDWVLAQPANVISIRHAYNDINGIRRSLGRDEYMLDNWQGMLVGKELNKVLQGVASSMNEELKIALERRLGTDTSKWQTTDVGHTVRWVVMQATSRFHVGLQLCRNEEYLDNMLNIMDEMIWSGAITGVFPSFMQPIISPIARWNLRRRVSRVMNLIEPLFRECLEALSSECLDEQPAHFFQMMMRYAQKERPEELNLVDMTNRLCMANFEAIHQTSAAITNMLLNIAASDEEYDTIAALRQEIDTHLGTDASEGAAWTRAKIAKLVKADSIARETMRLNSFANRSMFRKVMTDVQTEDGFKLPKDSILSFLSQPKHTDPDTFDDPLKFDPWRFSRIRESCNDGYVAATHSFVSTAHLLVFGRGRHACPGRYLVDFEVKMIVAYLVLKYDIRLPTEYNGKRPETMWLAEASPVPENTKIEVRRRGQA